MTVAELIELLQKLPGNMVVDTWCNPNCMTVSVKNQELMMTFDDLKGLEDLNGHDIAACTRSIPLSKVNSNE